MDTTFLTRLLPADFSGANPVERVRAAITVDPALAGRVSCDDAGVITLTGPGGGLPPASAKERQRWEMHVRLRLASELGESEASAAVVRWSDVPVRFPEPDVPSADAGYAAP